MIPNNPGYSMHLKQCHDGGEDIIWQTMLRQAWQKPEELVQAGYLPQNWCKLAKHPIHSFQFRVPQEYAQLMDPDWKNPCPIRRQLIPSHLEYDPQLPAWLTQLCQEVYQQETPWRQDAIADQELLATPRLTHRYQDRVLLHVSPTCAMYCRFCFRKVHMEQREADLYRGDFAAAYAYIEQHSEIREVILTGGDPLSLTDSALERLCTRLAHIQHIRSIRIHSRMPVTLPQRITTNFVRIFEHTNIRFVLMTHFNHVKEIRTSVCQALDRLRSAGVLLQNQTVLLRGVNDHASALRHLFEQLYWQGVQPIYLHHPDLTPATFGFRTSIGHGRALMEQLDGVLPGSCIPRYVIDLPRGHGKIQLQDYRIKHLWHRTTQDLGVDFYQIPTNRLQHKDPKTVDYIDIYPRAENDLTWP